MLPIHVRDLRARLSLPVKEPPKFTAHQIASLRRHCHLTQTDLALFLGLSSHSCVARWEAGQRTPDGSTRLLLAALRDSCL